MNEVLIAVWPGDCGSHRLRIFGAEIKDMTNLDAAHGHQIGILYRTGRSIMFFISPRIE